MSLEEEINIDVDYYVQKQNDTNGTWKTLKKFRSPSRYPFLSTKKFLGLIKYRELDSWGYEEECLKVRQKAVEYARNVSGKLRVVAFDEQFTQLGHMTYDKIVWQNGEWK